MAVVATAAGVHPRTSFEKTLVVIIAPGTVSSVNWEVPANDSLELSNLTISSTSKSVKGALRVQLLRSGEDPENFVSAALGQFESRPAPANLATPVVLAAGQKVALTVSCNGDQPACQARLELSGQLVAKSTHTDYSYGVLETVVAPGSVSTTSWKVPAKDTFQLTDMLLSTLDPRSQEGVATVVLTTPEGKKTTYLSTRIATLAAAPNNIRTKNPITFAANDTLSLGVSCPADQPACDVALLFSGKLS
jgi:hypothetical protein